VSFAPLWFKKWTPQYFHLFNKSHNYFTILLLPCNSHFLNFLNFMKFLKKLLLIVPALIVAFIIVRLVIAGQSQKAETAFHKDLQKTIELTSDAFKNGEKMPIEYTAKGANLSPALQWNNLPTGTKSVAVLVSDYDAPAPFLRLLTVDHWVVYNIPISKMGLEKGVKIEDLNKLDITVGNNISGEAAYTGPAPPMGVHEYFFRVYALSTDRITVPTPTKQAVMEAINGKILAYGELVGKF
jgi:Raf kinase inhibitor-like YbhB/YbcL family protein